MTDGVRGAGEHPDRSLRSPARYVALAGAGFLGGVGLVFVAAGAFAPVDAGETRSLTPVVVGLIFVVLSVSYVAAQRVATRRGPRPSARQLPGAVALPVRAGHRASLLAASLAIVALGVFVAVTGSGGRGSGLFIVAAGLAVGVWWWTTPVHLVVDPVGVTLPGRRKPRRISWDEIDDVVALGGWLPSLALGVRGPQLVTARLAGQAWPPSAIIALLDHYRARPRKETRHELADAVLVDRFREVQPLS